MFAYSPTNITINTTNQTFTFTTYSINGSVVYTYINCNNVISNVSGSPLGSTVSVFLNVSPTSVIRCKFALSSIEVPYYDFNVTYRGFTSNNQSFENSAKYIKDNTQEVWLTLLSYVIMLIIAIGIKQRYPDTRITGVIFCVGTIVFVSIGWIDWVAGGVSATIGLLMLYMGSR